jgi:short-subunit dehydrogenase
MVDLNCRSIVEITHAIGSKMVERRRGGIVLLASLLGWQGAPLSATYSATKAFVQSFAEALHIEWKSKGVDVLSSAPGPVISGFGDRANMSIQSGATPTEVALESLNALGRRMTVVPGRLSKLLTWSLWLCPRSWRVRIMQKVMSGLSNHGKTS